MEPIQEKVLFKEGSSFLGFRRPGETIYEFNWHLHTDEVEIVYIIKGWGTRYIGDTVRQYRAGEVVFVPPGVVHTWVSDADSTDNDAYVIHFEKNCFGENWFLNNELKLAKELMTSESAYVIKDVPQAESIFEKLVNSDGFKKVSAFFELLDFILKNPKEELGRFTDFDESPRKEKFNQIIDYLRDHFREELTVESIAEEMSMSTYQLRTMFKKQTYNKSVLQYLNELRVFEACRLMQNDQYTISYLSGLAGFNNLSYFNRIFLKVTGKTPREYRKVFC